MRTMNNKNTKAAKELYEQGITKLNLLDGTKEENQVALELLEEAANKGYKPAIDELADYYHSCFEFQIILGK